MGSELKACPFCGGGARITDDGASWWGRCVMCGSEGIVSDSAGEAISAWNRRSPSPAPVGEPVAWSPLPQEVKAMSDERINQLWHLKVGTPATIAVRIFAHAIERELRGPQEGKEGNNAKA